MNEKKNLIEGNDWMAQSQVEPLVGLGIDHATFTDGESTVQRTGDMTTLTKEEEVSGLKMTFRVIQPISAYEIERMQTPGQIYFTSGQAVTLTGREALPRSDYMTSDARVTADGDFSSKRDPFAIRFTQSNQLTDDGDGPNPLNCWAANHRQVYVSTFGSFDTVSFSDAFQYPVEQGRRMMFPAGRDPARVQELKSLTQREPYEQFVTPRLGFSVACYGDYTYADSAGVGKFSTCTHKMVSVTMKCGDFDLSVPVAVTGSVRNTETNFLQPTTDQKAALLEGSDSLDVGFVLPNDDKLGFNVTALAVLATQITAPGAVLANQYMAVAPARVGGVLCGGILTTKPVTAGISALTEWFEGTTLRVFPSSWHEGLPAPESLLYKGHDAGGTFETEITPKYEFSVLNQHLTAQLLQPIVRRVGPRQLCAVVYSYPGFKPADSAGAEAIFSDLVDEYFEFSHKFVHSEGLDNEYTQDIWSPKASVTPPEDFAFVLWSDDNGRSWSQVGDGLWHRSLTGAGTVCNAAFLALAAVQKAWYSVIIPDDGDSCLLICPQPHLIANNTSVDDLYAGGVIFGGGTSPNDPLNGFVPDYAYKRGRGLTEADLSHLAGAAGNPDGAAHDAYGLFDFYDSPWAFAGFRASVRGNALFSTKLWQWAVYRVSRSGIQYLTSLGEDFPPCDYAVSWTSDACRDYLYLQLKPVFPLTEDSWVLNSEDHGQTWTRTRVPPAPAGPHGDGVGYIFPAGGNKLFMTARERVEPEEGGRWDSLRLYESSDRGESWKGRERLGTFWLPDFRNKQGQQVSQATKGYTTLGTRYIPPRSRNCGLSAGTHATDFVLLANEDGSPPPLHLGRPELHAA